MVPYIYLQLAPVLVTKIFGSVHQPPYFLLYAVHFAYPRSLSPDLYPGCHPNAVQAQGGAKRPWSPTPIPSAGFAISVAAPHYH